MATIDFYRVKDYQMAGEGVTCITQLEPISFQKSVAIIGNSDRLKHRKDGPLIDSFDTVIRLNYASPMGAHTGEKTTIRLFGCPHRLSLAQKYISGIRTIQQLDDYYARILQESIVLKINESYEWINDYLESIGMTQRFPIGAKKSTSRTGFVIIMKLVAAGLKPHVFGFDLEDKPMVGHYSGYTITANDVSHNVPIEKEVQRELIKRDLIVMH